MGWPGSEKESEVASQSSAILHSWQGSFQPQQQAAASTEIGTAWPHRRRWFSELPTLLVSVLCCPVPGTGFTDFSLSLLACPAC